MVAVAVAYWWHGRDAKTAAASAKIAQKGLPAVLVVAAQAVRGSIGVYVTGLGAITPLATVTVKSRVDGQLMRVHFKEGELVKQGDTLIEIPERSEGKGSRDAIFEACRINHRSLYKVGIRLAISPPIIVSPRRPPKFRARARPQSQRHRRAELTVQPD